MQLCSMAEPFIQDLHIIHAQVNYRYIYNYNLKAYLQIKSIKKNQILKTNKPH